MRKCTPEHTNGLLTVGSLRRQGRISYADSLVLQRAFEAKPYEAEEPAPGDVIIVRDVDAWSPARMVEEVADVAVHAASGVAFVIFYLALVLIVVVYSFVVIEGFALLAGSVRS